MKCIIKQHGFSFVVAITGYVKMHKLKIGDIVEVRINRVSSGSHPHHKQKPLSHKQEDFMLRRREE